MRQVIESAAEPGDGVSIEREQASTAFRSMPHFTTWDGKLVASERTNELIGNFDQYIKLEKGYARNGFPSDQIYVYDPEPDEPTPFEVNKDVVALQEHNRFNPGPFHKGSAIFPGHGEFAEDQSRGSSPDSLNGGPSTVSRSAGYAGGGVITCDVNGNLYEEVQTNHLSSDNRFAIEWFEPVPRMDSIAGSITPVFEIGSLSGPCGTSYMTGCVSANTEKLGINQTIQNGIDIDQLTGNRFDQNAHTKDNWSAAAAINQFVQGANTGMIGKYHWSDLAEFGTASNMYKAAGVVNETYECTSKGMKNVWNGSEERFNRQIDDSPEFNGSVDFNGDGHSGDAPTGDGCDGKPSLLDSAWEALKGWWEGDGDNKDSDDESTSDPNECFEMPWLNERYFSLGAGAENYEQNGMSDSSQISISYFGSGAENHEQNFNDFLSQVPAFDHALEASSFQNMLIS